MINLVDYLFNKIKPIIQGCDEQGINIINKSGEYNGLFK